MVARHADGAGAGDHLWHARRRAGSADRRDLHHHEQRGEYVARVKAAAAEALAQNGLELESVAITDLDQTDLEYFNPSNRFDAEGLTRLMLMAAKALLDRNQQPSRADVIEAISGNICRCTGYEPIINAILAAASSSRVRA